MTRYIFRIDDVNPCMNQICFQRVMEIFATYNITPLLGIVPDNKDASIGRDNRNPVFWEQLYDLYLSKNVEVAMHGFNHLYQTNEGGLLRQYGFKPQSEFAGLSYIEQREKLQKGIQLLRSKGIETDVFMAPGHTFDKETVKALGNLSFRAITDGVGLYPYFCDGMVMIPQQVGSPREFPLGIITICLHTNSIRDNDLKNLEDFIKQNKCKIIKFSDALSFQPRQYHKLLNFLFRLPYWLACKIKRK